MRIAITKGEREDRVAITRGDGSTAGFTFPKKGPVPHDAFHYFIERELGMTRGFWGLVSAGMDPAEVGALAAAGGHASAKRAEVPDGGIVELLQAERLVECFEAESWSGGADDAGILAMAEPGWRSSHVPPPAMADGALGNIRDNLRAFSADWAAMATGGTSTLEWDH